MAVCEPELRTVPLNLPVEANIQYSPTCVRLEQCGGCCSGPLLTCQPTVTKTVKFQVRVWSDAEVVHYWKLLLYCSIMDMVLLT